MIIESSEPIFDQVKAVQPAASGEGNLLPVTGDFVLEHLDTWERVPIPIYRVLKNASGDLRAERVDPKSVASAPAAERAKKSFLVEKDWQHKVFSHQDPFGTLLEELQSEPPEFRTRAIGELKATLAELKTRDAEPMLKAHAIMDTISRAFLLNKASLKLKPSEVTTHQKTMARESSAIVGSALEMAEDPLLVSGLFEAFQDLSNGQTVNHVARVFGTYSGFLRFYNLQHTRRLSHSLRRVFQPVYGDAYRRLLPGLPDRLLLSDHVLQLPSFDSFQIREYALGAFLHDIGKMGNIDYFESDAAYDPQQIRQHVFLSAGLILMNYGNEHDQARLLAGDHHNALGHPAGYGVTRFEREKGVRSPVETIRCLSSDPDDFISGEALGWLPVEMLAVNDVYDAMIDNSRAYKKPMSTGEAAVFLEDTMVAQGKLDPVIVDLFIDYLRAQGQAVPADRGFAYKVSVQ